MCCLSFANVQPKNYTSSENKNKNKEQKVCERKGFLGGEDWVIVRKRERTFEYLFSHSISWIRAYLVWHMLYLDSLHWRCLNHFQWEHCVCVCLVHLYQFIVVLCRSSTNSYNRINLTVHITYYRYTHIHTVWNSLSCHYAPFLPPSLAFSLYTHLFHSFSSLKYM